MNNSYSITMENTLTDKELLQATLQATGMTQMQLADILLIDQSAISHIIRGAAKNMRPRLRKKCEELLAEAKRNDSK